MDAVLSENFALLFGVKFMEISAVQGSSSKLTWKYQINTTGFGFFFFFPLSLLCVNVFKKVYAFIINSQH